MKMRKILALIIALTMCISVFPARIFAVDYNGVEFTALDGTGENGEGEKFEKRKNQIKNIEIKKCIANKPLQVKIFLKVTSQNKKNVVYFIQRRALQYSLVVAE